MTTTVTTEKLIEDLQVVVRDAEALLQATAAQTGEKIEGVRARATESLRQARQRIAAAQAGAAREIREAADSTDEYVREHPWQAVGIAAGAGLLIGLLIGRR
ncbi:MAG: DUF883 domain-containing protein [Gammaproteobacteria bacterium]|nr:DUF883 domain-containing protein [Gammaproteobacteria bacterium]